MMGGESMADDELEVFDLDDVVVHLGQGLTAQPFDHGGWGEGFGDRYRDAFSEPEVAGGRLVTLFPQTEDWPHWERHPAGEELVVLVTGRVRLFQEHEGTTRQVVLTPGKGIVNPPGAWHTADVLEPGLGLFVTPSAGTDHKPR